MKAESLTMGEKDLGELAQKLLDHAMALEAYIIAMDKEHEFIVEKQRVMIKDAEERCALVKVERNTLGEVLRIFASSGHYDPATGSFDGEDKDDCPSSCGNPYEIE
jgi:hypothetical protein